MSSLDAEVRFEARNNLNNAVADWLALQSIQSAALELAAKLHISREQAVEVLWAIAQLSKQYA